MPHALSFSMNWPGEALFGPGQCDGLGTLLAGRGQRRALIVTDSGIQAAGLLARVETALAKGGVASTAYTGVEPNPTTLNVAQAHEIWQNGAFDALIALGGGSAIDTAKGVMAQIATGLDVEQALGTDIDAGTGPTPPFYALPTTSGTGSESSLGAVLKSTERKFVIRGRRLQPGKVILDPELTLSLPARMTALTGFDAYCHAIGAFANNQINPVADELALHSMRLLIDWLPRAVADGADIEARSAVMTASWLAGICIGQKGVDGIHGLCTPVESRVNATHGEVLGIIMPHILAFNIETDAARYALAARRLGLAFDDSTDAAAADAMVTASLALRDLTRGAATLSDLGLSVTSVPELIEMALLSQATERNGRPLQHDQIRKIYEKMM
ncbi:MAG: iron-containing alcohol dehydrogenase family protein [Roseinatronobacter sp.]